MATLEFVKSNYISFNHYNLAMDLCCDKLASSATELMAIVNGFFGKDNNKEVKQAFDDYNVIFN